MKKPMTVDEIRAELKELKAIKIDYSKFKPSRKDKNGAIAPTVILEIGITIIGTVLGAILEPLMFGAILFFPVILVALTIRPIYQGFLKESYIPEDPTQKVVVLRRNYLKSLLRNKKPFEDPAVERRNNKMSIQCTTGYTNPASPFYIGK